MTEALLFIGAATVLLCCLGVALMPTYAGSLHYVGPASTMGAVAIAAAVIFQEGLSQYGIKAALIALLLIVTAPLTAHVTGRAGRIRRTGRLKVAGERHARK